MRVDFQFHIDRPTAMATDRFPLPPEDVVAAYRRKQLTPVRATWLNCRSGEACAAGALVAGEPGLPPDYLDVNVNEIASAMGCVDAADMQESDATRWLDAFSTAFDHRTIEEIEVYLAQLVQDPATPGWEILAHRNALYVRRAMDAVGLSPREVA